MTVWFIALSVIAIGLLAVTWVLAALSRTTSKSPPIWATICFLICIGLNIAGLMEGFGTEPMQAPGNYTPFIIMANTFFLPAGLLVALIGWHDRREEMEDERRARRTTATSDRGRLP